jgi:GSH-dependent disulfide-bond oxidoreductase
MIEVFTTPTANGQKVHIMLAETGLAHRLHVVDLQKGEHRAPAMLAHNPIGKIPAIHDPEGPGGPISLGETGAICFYLADKAGMLGPQSAREKAEFDYWAFAISSSLSMPFAMQFYFSNLAPERLDWAIETFEAGAYRTLEAFEARLSDRPYMAGERFSVLDALLFPHLATSAKRLSQGLAPLPALAAYRDRVAARPKVAAAMGWV